jgi:hypothetical protein
MAKPPLSLAILRTINVSFRTYIVDVDLEDLAVKIWKYYTAVLKQLNDYFFTESLEEVDQSVHNYSKRFSSLGVFIPKSSKKKPSPNNNSNNATGEENNDSYGGGGGHGSYVGEGSITTNEVTDLDMPHASGSTVAYGASSHQQGNPSNYGGEDAYTDVWEREKKKRRERGRVSLFDLKKKKLLFSACDKESWAQRKDKKFFEKKPHSFLKNKIKEGLLAYILHISLLW